MAIDFKVCRKSAAGNIITPKARMSFPELFEPSYDMGKTEGKKKYRLTLIIPADADITLLKTAAAEVVKAKYGEKIPANLRSPFLKGGEIDSAGCEEGMTVIRSSTTSKPNVINAKAENVSDESEVYGGRWCVASLSPYVYEIRDPKSNAVINRGVSFGLQNVQLLDHDEPLGRKRVKAEDEFAPITDDNGEKPNSVNDLF